MIIYIRRIIKQFSRWMEYKPPPALTSRGWKLFNQEFKRAAPIRYWLDNDFRRRFVLPVKWKYDEISAWISYRTINRYHILQTGLPPGYRDVSTVMLHTNFNLLKDFVEVELAARQSWNDEMSWCQKHVPFYHVFFKFRNPEYGVKQLEWECTLDSPSLPPFEQSPAQALAAREILALYVWWVTDRPLRESTEPQLPLDVTDDWCDIFGSDIDRNTEAYKQYQADVVKAEAEEADWDNIDNAMLVRLVNVRNKLWS